MKQTIDTGLDQATSKKALGKAMEAYQERFKDYEPRFEWTADDRGEFGFNARGVKLQGHVVVRHGEIDVDMHVPLLFRVFQGRAMDVIHEHMNIWIAKAKRGEI